MGAEEGTMKKQLHRTNAAQINGEHSYAVGYGKPPAHTQFKPGQSGNPKGRRKGPRNVRTVVEEALNQRIRIKEGDRIRSLTKLDGVILTMVSAALGHALTGHDRRTPSSDRPETLYGRR
jgi:hypothetical protein